MSGRGEKLKRREIRRAAEPGLRTMQEQQENAIKEAIARCNTALWENQMLAAHVHNLEKRIEALEPVKELTHAD